MSNRRISRRDFVKRSVVVAAGFTAAARHAEADHLQSASPLFEISLAEWSLHRAIFGDWLADAGFSELTRRLRTDPRSALQGSLDPLDFAKTARREFGIDAVEYVNTFFFDRATDSDYLRAMKTRADDEGVRSLLIMCDSEGRLGDPDPADRAAAIENHRKWLDAAAFLGCHAIRVNAASAGSRDEQARLAADGLARLAALGDEVGLDVIVENHGGLSSDGIWLTGVLESAGHPRLGTLPDFGNFDLGDGERYDNYRGVAEMMPYARAVSAKSFDFGQDGEESTLDFERLLRTVLDAGYRGHIGVEYEGTRLSEPDGIRATKSLLERVRGQLAAAYR